MYVCARYSAPIQLQFSTPASSLARNWENDDQPRLFKSLHVGVQSRHLVSERNQFITPHFTKHREFRKEHRVSFLHRGCLVGFGLPGLWANFISFVKICKNEHQHSQRCGLPPRFSPCRRATSRHGERENWMKGNKRSLYNTLQTEEKEMASMLLHLEVCLLLHIIPKRSTLQTFISYTNNRREKRIPPNKKEMQLHRILLLSGSAYDVMRCNASNNKLSATKTLPTVPKTWQRNSSQEVDLSNKWRQIRMQNYQSTNHSTCCYSSPRLPEIDRQREKQQYPYLASSESEPAADQMNGNLLANYRQPQVQARREQLQSFKHSTTCFLS